MTANAHAHTPVVWFMFRNMAILLDSDSDAMDSDEEGPQLGTMVASDDDDDDEQQQQQQQNKKNQYGKSSKQYRAQPNFRGGGQLLSDSDSDDESSRRQTPRSTRHTQDTAPDTTVKSPREHATAPVADGVKAAAISLPKPPAGSAEHRHSNGVTAAFTFQPPPPPRYSQHDMEVATRGQQPADGGNKRSSSQAAAPPSTPLVPSSADVERVDSQ